MATTLLYLILVFIFSEFIFERILNYLNMASWQQPLPAEINDLFTLEQHTKATAYAKYNYQVGLVSTTLSLLISVSFLYFGGFAWADSLVRTFSDSSILQGLLFFALLSLGSSIINLPFEVYSTFVIEEKYGFNKTTVATFITDKLKGLILGALIGGLLYVLIAWLYQILGSNFWWAAWLVVGSFLVLWPCFTPVFFYPSSIN